MVSAKPGTQLAELVDDLFTVAAVFAVSNDVFFTIAVSDEGVLACA